MFTTLGSLMAGLGTVGLVLGWYWYQAAASATAVLAGLVMLGVLALDAAGGTTQAQPQSHASAAAQRPNDEDAADRQ